MSDIHDLMILCDFQTATHVVSRYRKNSREMIWVKYGMDESGHLSKPSEGFFGSITPTGEKIDGWSAYQYFRSPYTEQPPAFPDIERAVEFFKETRPSIDVKDIVTKGLKTQIVVEYDWFEIQREE